MSNNRVRTGWIQGQFDCGSSVQRVARTRGILRRRTARDHKTRKLPGVLPWQVERGARQPLRGARTRPRSDAGARQRRHPRHCAPGLDEVWRSYNVGT